MLMSGEMSDEKPRQLYLKEKIDRWMVNEGYRRLYASISSLVIMHANVHRFVFVFFILHLMVFVFGMMNYGFTVGLIQSRTVIGNVLTIVT